MRSLTRGDRLDLGHGACRKIWIIVNGMAAICTGLSDGRRQIIGLEGSGDIVCGMASTGGADCWVEALCDTLVCELDLSTAANPFNRSDQIGSDTGLMVELFALIHRRLEACSAHLITLGRLDSTERVVLFVLDMANRIGSRCGTSILIDLPMTREDIADYLGLNTETISRIFTRLKKSGLVTFPSRTTLAIANPLALEQRLPVDVFAATSASDGHLETFLAAFQTQQAAPTGEAQ